MFRTYLSAFQIGIIAGMRAMSAPALVSHKLSHSPLDLPTDSKLHFLTSETTANVLKVLAGGELIGDKVPGSPDRIGATQLPFRVMSGALSGAALGESEGGSLAYSALFGALGAVTGSFAFYHLRHWLTKEQGIPDPIVAVVEDALAIGAGWYTVNAVEPSFAAAS